MFVWKSRDIILLPMARFDDCCGRHIVVIRVVLVGIMMIVIFVIG